LSAWRKALLLEIVNELQQPIQQGPATSGDPDESLPRGSRTERLDSPRLCVFFDNLGAMEDPKILAWKKIWVVCNMFKSHHISRISAGLAMIRIRFRIQGNLTRLGRERKLKIDFVHKKKKKIIIILKYSTIYT